MRFLIRLIINTVALWVAVKLVPGLHFSGTWVNLALAAIVFGVVNASIGVLVKLLALPVTILTLGLFALVVNGLLFWLAAHLSSALGLGLSVDGFVPAFEAALVTSITSFVLSLFFSAAESTV
jgi:putative membrane protein